MTSLDKAVRPRSPPGSAAKSATEDTASTNTSSGPLFPSCCFSAPLVASPFTTSYSPFQTVSTVSGASSHVSMKQQSRAEVVARTVHLRCLPPFLKQKELADVFDACGEYLRVRICGNAATHQKWIYGFVEFATPEAAAAMLTHSGMELSNGPDKPPLRLKCSPSKQPILDCMAYDADVIGGTPCGFGRGYLADCTLNDALLVVGNGSSGGGGTTAADGKGGGGRGNRTSAASRALTALTVSSIRKVAATGCGCGCAGVNCCGCCRCWKGAKAQENGAAEATGDACVKEGESVGTTGGAVDGGGGGGCGGCCGGGSSAEVTAATEPAAATSKPEAAGLTIAATHAPGEQCEPTKGAVNTPVATSATFADLSQLPATMNATELDVLQQLAAAFDGLRTTAAAEDGQLDGPAIVRRAETMALDALARASHLSSDTRLQDILCDLTELLSFLDASAAVTGGAAQTASGDCTATLPQRVTQLRMLTNLVGALLCLLRRSVADAVPYVEALLVTFAQIPPSSLLLQAREHEKRGGADVKSAVDHPKEREEEGIAVFTVPGQGGGYRDTVDASQPKRVSSFPLGAFVDEDVAECLLDLVDGDDDEDDHRHKNNSGNKKKNNSRGTVRVHTGEESTLNGDVDDGLASCEKDNNNKAQSNTGSSEVAEQQQLLLLSDDRSPSSCSDESTAYLNSADMADLCRRDDAFTRYVLNAVVSVGIAMERVQPVIARSAYTLANARAAEVLGEASSMVAASLAASPTVPRLCELLFKDTGTSGQTRDITFFPRRFFESVNAVRQRVHDTRGTECFWRQLPPNHVVPLFKF